MVTVESSTATATTQPKQLQRPWQSLFGCDSSIWMHKSNIYMRHGFSNGNGNGYGDAATHNSHVEQSAWWGRHLNAITQREIAGKLLRSSDGDRDETRIEPAPSPLQRTLSHESCSAMVCGASKASPTRHARCKMKTITATATVTANSEFEYEYEHEYECECDASASTSCDCNDEYYS